MSDDYDWTRHLWEDEQVVWQGKPSAKPYLFSWIDLYLSLFVIGSLQFASAEQPFSMVDPPDYVTTYVLPVATVVILATLGWRRLGMDRSRRLNETYALTNHRAVVADLDQREVVRSLTLGTKVNVFENGYAYRYVTFTTKTKAMWWLTRGIMLDGPPDLFGRRQSDDLHFLAPEMANEVAGMARDLIRRKAQ